MSNFTEDEIAEAANLAEQDEEKRTPPPKKTVKTYINPVAFQEDVAINIADLDNAFITQASLFAHYASNSAKAEEQLLNAKLALDVKEAQLNVFHRKALLAAGEKVTESMVTNAVLTDPRYIRARKTHIEAKGVVEMLKGATESFRQRRDMLYQLGNNAREEFKGNMFIKSKEVSDEVVAHRRKLVSND